MSVFTCDDYNKKRFSLLKMISGKDLKNFGYILLNNNKILSFILQHL